MGELMLAIVAALARRLINHTKDIDPTMHMEAISAFQSLKARVSCLILHCRNIDNWTRSQDNALLGNILEVHARLGPRLGAP